MRGLRITLERKRKIEREEEEEKEEDASRLNIDEPGRSSNSIRKHSSSARMFAKYMSSCGLILIRLDLLVWIILKNVDWFKELDICKVTESSSNKYDRIVSIQLLLEKFLIIILIGCKVELCVKNNIEILIFWIIFWIIKRQKDWKNLKCKQNVLTKIN